MHECDDPACVRLHARLPSESENRFARALAWNALNHSDWDFDTHVKELVRLGFNSMISENVMAIHAAVLKANELATAGRI